MMNGRSLLLLLAVAILSLSVLDSVSGANQLQLTLFNTSKYPLAVCNDGSPSGYYFKAGTTNPNRWVFHLEGGWWCWDDNSCAGRASGMVSSKTWPSSRSPGGIFNADPIIAPAWAGVNLVYMPYCTSDAWSGSGTGNVSGSVWQFRGKDVVRAVFDTFFGSQQLTQPQEVLFSGCSAGGQGLLYNLDAMSLFVKAKTPSGLRFKGLADSGWMMNFPSIRNPNTEIHTQFKAGWDLWKTEQSTCSFINPVDSFNCFFSPTAISYLSTPVLIQSSAYDAFQVPYDCCSPPFTTPQAQSYSKLMAISTRDSMRTLIRPPHSVFSPSCFTHCLTEGKSFQRLRFPYSLEEKLTNWFFDVQPDLGPLIDDCGFNCTASCWN